MHNRLAWRCYLWIWHPVRKRVCRLYAFFLVKLRAFFLWFVLCLNCLVRNYSSDNRVLCSMIVREDLSNCTELVASVTFGRLGKEIKDVFRTWRKRTFLIAVRSSRKPAAMQRNKKCSPLAQISVAKSLEGLQIIKISHDFQKQGPTSCWRKEIVLLLHAEQMHFA